MKARTNKCPKYSKSNINKIINKKIANLSAVGKGKRKKRSRKTQDNINMENDSSEQEQTMIAIDKVDAKDLSDSFNASDVANKSDNSSELNEISVSNNDDDHSALLINIDLQDLQLVDLSSLMSGTFLDNIL